MNPNNLGEGEEGTKERVVSVDFEASLFLQTKPQRKTTQNQQVPTC